MKDCKPGDPEDRIDCPFWTNCVTNHELSRAEQEKQYEARVLHVLNIDIPAWQNGVRSPWHTVRLLAIIANSDMQNRERHRLGFPAEVEAYERWMSSETPTS